MPKQIKIESLDPEMLPDVDDMMFGRRWVRELYTPAQQYDIVQFRFWRDYLSALAMSRFEWINVPAGIDARAIEYIMLMFGQGAMFKDQGLLFAQAAPSNNINMYYNPNRIMLVAPNGNTWSRHCESWVEQIGDANVIRQRDAVMLFNDMTRSPTMTYIRNYAKRLATYDRIIDVNIGAQRTPYIVKGSEETEGTRKTVIKKLISNDQWISVNSDMAGIVDIEVLQTEAPYVADKIMADKQKVVNEAVTWFGVDNTNSEKKERMIDAEATANNEQIMVMRASAYKCRKYFCEQCNMLFDIDPPMDVRWAVPHLPEQAEQDAREEAGDFEEFEDDGLGNEPKTGGGDQ